MRAAYLQVVFLVFMLLLGAAQESSTYIARYLTPFPVPQVYKDPNSGTIFYVESDGQHVAAISSGGKLMWNKDPFKDGHLQFYRTQRSQIVYIGAASSCHPAGEKPDKFVAVAYNSSQFGVLRIGDDQFTFCGQD